MPHLDLNEINKRYNLIGQRLSAIEKEQRLLEKERESLHILLELYTNNQHYYDIIKEESTITNALTPTSTSTTIKRKVYKVDHDLLVEILSTYGPQTANEVRKLYPDDGVPYSTIRDGLQYLYHNGILSFSHSKHYSIKRKEIDE